MNTDEEDIDYVELHRLLSPIGREQTRAILLFVTQRYAEAVFNVSQKLGLLERDWAWIVSEQCLGASNIPQGVLSARLSQLEAVIRVEDAAGIETEGILRLARRVPAKLFGLQ